MSMSTNYSTTLKDSGTCRIFFSSPFGGMEDEREELTRRYFPEINHLCNSHGLQFVAVDMRWGITTEAAASGQVINICLHELDRSDMFVGFFGQRYGWHGDDDKTLQENFDNAVGRYPWIDQVRDKSVTELEFLHGHLNQPGALPAYFCFRDKEYDDKMREKGKIEGNKKLASKYSSSSPLATELLDDLKHRVQASKDKTLGVLMNYKTPKEAAQNIYEAILTHLKNYLLKRDPVEQQTARGRLLAQHDAFLISRTKLYEGYEDLISKLTNNLDLENPENVVVLGPSGCGKSSLLCNWITKIRSSHSHCCVVYHFIGYAQESADIARILSRLVGEFDHVVMGLQGQVKKSQNQETNDIRELMRRLAVVMETLTALGKQPVVVLDGLAKIKKQSSTLERTLYYLPKSLPSRCVLVVSTQSVDTENIAELQERNYTMMEVSPLNSETKRTICIKNLKAAGKELSPPQLDRIVEDKQTENPLFLKIALTELIVFGYFRLLDKKIDTLISANSAEELFEQVLQRLEEDYNDSDTQDNLVEKVMCAIYLSNHGLSEKEIKEMFHIDAQSWSPLFFAIETYLIEQAGLLLFGYSELRETVAKRYLSQKTKRNEYLKMIITYFESTRQKSFSINQNNNINLSVMTSRAADELPQLIKTMEDYEKLAEVLLDPIIMSCLINSDLDLYPLISLWRVTGRPWIDIAQSYTKSLELYVADIYLVLEEQLELDTKSPGLIAKKLLKNLIHLFKTVGDFESCVLLYKMHVRILEENLATGKLKDPMKVEKVNYKLACLYVDHGVYTEAEKLHEKVFQKRKQKYLEEGDKATANTKIELGHSYHGIGIIYYSKQEYDKSEEYLMEAKRLQEGLIDDNDLMSTFSNLSNVYLQKQLYDISLEYAKRALQMVEDENYGHMLPLIGNMLNNIGLIHRRMGDIDKAEEFYQRALSIKRNALGDFHLDIPVSLINLGAVENIRKNFDKALEYFEECIKIYKVCKVPETADYFLKAQENRLLALWKMKRYDETIKEFLPFFDVMKKAERVDYCLGEFVTHIVRYLISQQEYEQALNITLTLINSKLRAPSNILHLHFLDNALNTDDNRPERPYHMSLDAALERWPDNVELVRQKIVQYYLPANDVEATVQLLNSLHDNTELGMSVYDFGLGFLDPKNINQDMAIGISAAGLQKYPDTIMFLKTIASTRRAQQHHDLALPYYKRILELEPDNSTTYLFAIQTAAHTNNLDLGQQFCNTAKAKFPDDADLMEKMNALSKLLQDLESQQENATDSEEEYTTDTDSEEENSTEKIQTTQDMESEQQNTTE